jgi:hypothetical protein
MRLIGGAATAVDPRGGEKNEWEKGGKGASALVVFPWTYPPAMKIRGPACFPSGTAGCVVLVTKMPHRRAFDPWRRGLARGRVLATWLILPVVYACLKD